MLGSTHAVSGATGWLAGCAALAAVDTPPEPSIVIVGALLSAGFALLPDIDHPGSTIARTLGPITRFVAYGVAAAAGTARTATCAHCAAGPARGGHRGITHTLVFALGAGLVLSIAAAVVGRAVGLVAVWLAVGLAARGVFTAKERGTLGAATLATVVTGAVHVTTGDDWWWIGLPVAWGTFAHSLGDAMTLSGAPLWWPIRVRGCAWRPVGSPYWLRFRTGGLAELVVAAMLWVVSAGCFGFALASISAS